MNVTELYQQVLGRAPDPEGLANWTAVYGADVDAAELANFQQAAGAEIAAMTVTDLYARILGRAPDAAGLNHWSATFGNSIDMAEIAAFRGAAQAELNARGMAAMWEPPKKSATALEVERTAQNYHAAVAADNAAAGTLATRMAIYNAGREFLAAVATNGGGYIGVDMATRPDLVQAHWDTYSANMVSQEIESSWTSTWRPLVKTAAVVVGAYFAAPYLMQAVSGAAAGGGGAAVSSAAEIAAATGMNMEAAAIYSASGFSAAELGAAAALDAAAAAGSVISNISTAQSIYDPIAAMTGGGVGVTDAAVLDAAMAAPGATAGMAGNIAAASADLYGTAAASGFSAADTFSVMQQIQQGAKVDSIFSGLTGTVQDLAGAAVSTYSAVQGVQLQRAQIDLANQQAQNAARAAANPPMYQTASGGINWTVIGLGVAALLGVFLVLKKA